MGLRDRGVRYKLLSVSAVQAILLEHLEIEGLAEHAIQFADRGEGALER